MNFYEDSCPEAEDIVERITWSRVASDPGLSAKLLRMHYHDCFVRGCDASILLDTVDNSSPAEKDAIPNRSLFGFDVIEDIKTEIEKSKKPKWEVHTGRKDGRVSLASQVSGNLHSPFANFSGLMEVFTNKGLDEHDLVTLSGTIPWAHQKYGYEPIKNIYEQLHTLGVAHCGVFSKRLYNFTGKGDADPSLDETYADFLRSKCQNPADPSITVEMDPECSLLFDKSYFTILLQNKGLFQSDAALLTDPIALSTVKRFQESNAFFGEFSGVMKRMGAMDVLTGNEGEIRKICKAVN